MSFFGQIQHKDSRDLDIMGRLRVSNPATVFDSQFEYTKNPLVFDEALTGAATSTHLPDESAIRLRCTTASGDIAERQSHRRIRWSPGKSMRISLNVLLGAKKTNVRKRVGYFDAEDGIFVEQDGTNLKVVRRTKTSGSVVDNAVNQASWNIDPLNGTGPSGVTLDETKIQTLIISYSLHRIRVGFMVSGQLWPVHDFISTNTLTTVPTRTPNLPVRFEIENTGTAASNTDLIHFAVSVIVEGENNREDLGVPFAASNGTTAITVTTRRPILSIRPATTLGGKTNYRRFLPKNLTITHNASGVALWEVVYKPGLTGASFTSVNANSGFEFDVAASALSGGTVLYSGYAIGTNQSKSSVETTINDAISVTIGLDGVQDILTVAATNVTGSSSMIVALEWVELI